MTDKERQSERDKKERELKRDTENERENINVYKKVSVNVQDKIFKAVFIKLNDNL